MLAPCRAHLTALLDQICDQGWGSDEIVLLGFSQGATAAYDVALVVDDEPVNLVLVAGILADHYEMREGAACGRDGLARAKEELPSLVLTDIAMPDLGGYDLCRALKDDPATQDIPVIFLSGVIGIAEHLAAHDAGGEDFLSKPFDPHELLFKVSHALRRAEEKNRLASDASSAFHTAMIAMTSAAELGVVLNFVRNSFACSNYAELADAAVAACAEFGLAACVRRIEAVTGKGALTWLHHAEHTLRTVAELTKGGLDTVEEKVSQLLDRNRKLEKELEQLKGKLASRQGGDLAAQAVDVNGVKVLASKLEGADVKTLRDTLDQLKNKLGSAAIVLAAVENDKVRLVAGVTKDYTSKLKAGELVNAVAQQVGGKGSGRPDMAQAGADNPAALAGALPSAPDQVRSLPAQASRRAANN